MQSVSLEQMITDATKSLAYTGAYNHLTEVRRTAEMLGVFLANRAECEVWSLWDTIPSLLGGKTAQWGDVFLEVLHTAWVKEWVRKEHIVFHNGRDVVLLPEWAKGHREQLQEQGVKMLYEQRIPYLTMERRRYNVLREKWGCVAG